MIYCCSSSQSLKLHLTEVALFTPKVEDCAAIRALVSYCTSDVKYQSVFALWLYIKDDQLCNFIHSVSSLDLSIVVVRTFSPSLPSTPLTFCLYFTLKWKFDRM